MAVLCLCRPLDAGGRAQLEICLGVAAETIGILGKTCGSMTQICSSLPSCASDSYVYRWAAGYGRSDSPLVRMSSATSMQLSMQWYAYAAF
jgi:hypothetical protein